MVLLGKGREDKLTETKSTLNRIGVALCLLAGIVCFVLHTATFLTQLSPMWAVPIFFIILGAVVCAKAVGFTTEISLPLTKLEIVGFVLLVYSVFTFIYFYRATGGASSVDVVNGQYVSESKGHIIRAINAFEFRMFPNLWTRVMSAWLGMMAVFCVRAFIKHPKAN